MLHPAQLAPRLYTTAAFVPLMRTSTLRFWCSVNTQLPGAPFTAERLVDAMMHDKKNEGGALTFILARDIGQAFVARDVAPEAVHSFLRERL